MLMLGWKTSVLTPLHFVDYYLAAGVTSHTDSVDGVPILMSERLDCIAMKLRQFAEFFVRSATTRVTLNHQGACADRPRRCAGWCWRTTTSTSTCRLWWAPPPSAHPATCCRCGLSGRTR
jgi:hypothetical protein